MTEELSGGCLDEREAFEAWATKRALRLTRGLDDEYKSIQTDEAWSAWKERASLSTSKQAGAEPVRECGNEECGWKGTTDRMLGSVGPLCPRCGETTEPAAPSDAVTEYNRVKQALLILLQEMHQKLELLDQHQPGYQHAKGWNAALVEVMNYVHGEALAALSRAVQPQTGAVASREANPTERAVYKRIADNYFASRGAGKEQAGTVAMPALSCKHSNRSDCGLFGMEEAAPVKFQRPSREWYAAKIAETLDDDFVIGSVAPQTDAELQALEREHMGDPDKQTGIYSPSYRIGRWLSAALEDPNTCEEMKSDIRDWFAAPGAAIAAREQEDKS